MIDSPKLNALDMVRPDGRIDRVAVSVAGGVGTLVYTGTDVPGRYVVRGNGQLDRNYIVRSPARESDLSLQDDAALKKIIATSSINLLSPSAPLAVGISRKASEWSIPLILVAIVALAIESMLTSRIAAPGGES